MLERRVSGASEAEERHRSEERTEQDDSQARQKIHAERQEWPSRSQLVSESMSKGEEGGTARRTALAGDFSRAIDESRSYSRQVVTSKTSGSGELQVGDGDELAGSFIPELFLQLFRKSCSGRVRLSGSGLEPTLVQFLRGIPERTSLPHHVELYFSVLGGMLPSDQLNLVKSHALKEGLDPISAAVKLALLPPAHEARVRRSFLAAVLKRLAMAEVPVCVNITLADGSTKSGAWHHARRAQEELGGSSLRRAGTLPAEELAGLVGLLNAVVGALCSAPDLSFYEKRLQSTWADGLVIRSDSEIHNLTDGSLRHVLLHLRRRAESPEMMVARQVASEREIIAVVYALRATGVIRSRPVARPGRSLRPDTPSTRPGREPPEPAAPPVMLFNSRAQPGSLANEISTPQRPPLNRPAREVNATRAVSNLPSPRIEQKPSEPVPPQGEILEESFVEGAAFGDSTVERDEETGLPKESGTHLVGERGRPRFSSEDEHRVEAAALEAWMLSVDDPSQQPRALLVAEMAARRYAENPRILLYLAYAYSQSRRDAEAEGVLRRVLMLDPDHAEAARELAGVRRRLTDQSQERSNSAAQGDKKRAH